MKNLDFENISSDAFRQYQNDQNEQGYFLVDVRQPEEYKNAHIPGSKLMPLDDLESKLAELPSDKDIFFYCHSGARSQAAAIISLDSGIQLQKVYNLIGGIMGWEGQTLPDFPKIAVFAMDATLPDMMLTAMNLEKAALRFYETIFKHHANESYADILKTLSLAEEAHAKTIYSHWQRTQNDPQPFEELFNDFDGEIMEGGQKLGDVIENLTSLGDNSCRTLMEFALNIEIQAYDLYRNMANNLGDESMQAVFLSISQMEKKHMQLLARIFKKCSN